MAAHGSEAVKRTHWHDEETGRTRTVVRIGTGVEVHRRSSEVTVDEPPPALARRAGRSRSDQLRIELEAEANRRRARLLARLEGPQGQQFIRAALRELIARGALDFMAED